MTRISRIALRSSGGDGEAQSRSTLVAACALALGVIALLALPGVAGAAVRTDQSSYAPGSTVTISGDNSDLAGYAPGETVDVVVSHSGQSTSCSATADVTGAWSCQITLASDSSAVGSYSYTATGQISGVSQSGTFTDSGCPNSNSLESHKNVDPKLIASYTTSGGEAKYSITTTNESPSEGIPGLIAYCVYTSPLPDETEATYVGAKGAWTAGSGGGYFDFERSDGNPDNLPFDGTTQSVGNARWTSGTVPANQVILLHINDEAECTALEGTPTETCFVRPGEVCHTLVGVGHFGPRGPTGTNLNNNMSTCTPNTAQPYGKQVFEMTWENGTQHMQMTKLTSASYANTGTEQTFSGTGLARVNKVSGYQITFTFTLKGGRWYLFLVIEKGGTAVWEHKLEPLNEGTIEKIS
jgi:hypothetical protein